MKITIPGQTVPISDGGGPVNPTWYEKLKFLEKLQPLSDIDNSSLQSQITANTNAITALQSSKSNVTRTQNFQGGTTYTFQLTDAGNYVEFQAASATTVTVPPNSSVAFPMGTQIDCLQAGAGKVTFAQGSGVTINSLGGNKSIGGQYIGVTLIKVGTDLWRLMGTLIP